MAYHELWSWCIPLSLFPSHSIPLAHSFFGASKRKGNCDKRDCAARYKLLNTSNTCSLQVCFKLNMCVYAIQGKNTCISNNQNKCFFMSVWSAVMRWLFLDALQNRSEILSKNVPTFMWHMLYALTIRKFSKYRWIRHYYFFREGSNNSFIT